MRKKGFSLIEVLLTVIIISMGLFGLMTVFDQASRGVVDADLDVMASGLAMEEMERLISSKKFMGYNDGSLNEGVTIETVTLGAAPGPLYTFERKVTINDVGTDLKTDDGVPEDSGTKRIDIEMVWSGTDRKINLSTIVTNYSF